jgi:hypothetical protein
MISAINRMKSYLEFMNAARGTGRSQCSPQGGIERELEAAATEACDLAGSSPAHVALQAAALLAVKLSSYYDCEAAPAVLQALLKVAGAA